jgi:Uma2 family endonuclease
MLFFTQVATKTQIRPDEYLRMTFEHDAEFVHGELVERAMPDEIHSAIQFFLLLRFGALIHIYALYPRAELRMRVAPDAYRIPDVAVFAGPHPPPVPDKPPLVVVEIVSQDDRHLDLMQKLEEYRQWGVGHIWVVNPATQGFSIYTEFGLQNVSSLSLPGYPLELTSAELFASL